MANTTLPLPSTPRLPARLPVLAMPPARLVQVCQEERLHVDFARARSNRFDDPHPVPEARFGTAYFATSLTVAVAETLLHDRRPQAGWFDVPPALIAAHRVIAFAGDPLHLADLTGAALKRLGGHAELTGTPSCRVPQRWAAALHAHPDHVDGLVYMSCQKNDEQAVVLFERARHKLAVAGAVPLAAHPHFGQVVRDLGIRTGAA